MRHIEEHESTKIQKYMKHLYTKREIYILKANEETRTTQRNTQDRAEFTFLPHIWVSICSLAKEHAIRRVMGHMEEHESTQIQKYMKHLYKKKKYTYGKRTKRRKVEPLHQVRIWRKYQERSEYKSDASNKHLWYIKI